VIEVATSITSIRVIRVLEQLIETHGKPKALRKDNGAEFIAHAFTEWCEERKIDLYYIEPGEPDQNAFVERLNRTYREEVLDAYLFEPRPATRQPRLCVAPNLQAEATTRRVYFSSVCLTGNLSLHRGVLLARPR
jgi:putative transposase